MNTLARRGLGAVFHAHRTNVGAAVASASATHRAAMSSTSSRRPGTEPWHARVSQPGSGDARYRFPQYNQRVHPPLEDLGYAEACQVRPAYVCHMRSTFKYSPEKMWYVASLVRGLSVEEAIKQLSFTRLKGALVAKEVLEEAQEMAVREHSVEFKTNLWVAESFCAKAMMLKGARRHARGRMGTVKYKYCNYFVTLEEGQPPKDYYEHRATKTPEQWIEYYLSEHRKKNIPFSW